MPPMLHLHLLLQVKMFLSNTNTIKTLRGGNTPFFTDVDMSKKFFSYSLSITLLREHLFSITF